MVIDRPLFGSLPGPPVRAFRALTPGDGYVRSTPAEFTPPTRVQVQAAAAPSPMAQIPTSILPMGKSTYDAFVGPSWTFSKRVGDGTLERTDGQIVLNTRVGQASLIPSPTDPSSVQISLPKGDTIAGHVQGTGDGVELDAADGRSVAFCQDGNHISMTMHGFGVMDKMGVYLRQKA